MMRVLTIASLALVTFYVTVACKSAVFGPIYPIHDFKEYDLILIGTVEHAVHWQGGYEGLKAFDLTVARCLKGGLNKGDKLAGHAKEEEARAVCPVHLNEGEDYLLLLTKSSRGYELSRFSYPVKKGYVYFDDYIAQIEKILGSDGER
jgi:hypothetical protein